MDKNKEFKIAVIVTAIIILVLALLGLKDYIEVQKMEKMNYERAFSGEPLTVEDVTDLFSAPSISEIDVSSSAPTSSITENAVASSEPSSSENDYEFTDITSGPLYDAVTSIYENVELLQRVDASVGTKTLVVTIILNEATPVDNARKFFEYTYGIMDKCTSAFVNEKYSAIEFSFYFLNGGENQYAWYYLDFGRSKNSYFLEEECELPTENLMEFISELEQAYAKAIKAARAEYLGWRSRP